MHPNDPFVMSGKSMQFGFSINPLGSHGENGLKRPKLKEKSD